MTQTVTVRRWNEDFGTHTPVEEEWPTPARSEDGTWSVDGPGWTLRIDGTLPEETARRICEAAADAIRFPTRPEAAQPESAPAPTGDEAIRLAAAIEAALRETGPDAIERTARALGAAIRGPVADELAYVADDLEEPGDGALLLKVDGDIDLRKLAQAAIGILAAKQA